MDYDRRQEQYQRFKDVAYYIIIAIVSFVSVSFLPFLQSVVAATMWWPTNGMEWTLWIASKVAISVINVVIFYSFIEQGKVNIKDSAIYKDAMRRLSLTKKQKQLLPRSPKRYNTIT